MVKEERWEPMGKRHNWTHRDGGDITYELLVWDGGRKLDRFIWNTNRRFKEILELLRLKFGMG